MRFDNWDVLLFPLNSKVPIPEFKTEAYSVDDLEAPPIFAGCNTNNHQYPISLEQNLNGSCVNPSLIQNAFNYAQIPLLSCFVPSQSEGTKFMVSIHSWKPVHHNFIHPASEKGTKLHCFQVRVFVDGHLVSGDIIKPDTSWPVMIDTSFLNPKMSRGFLSWPQFHEEQLSQAYWRAGDSYGRIKIVISQGVLTLETGLVSAPQNLIVFAFQHAPMQILNSANIAWSSDNMGLNPDRFVRSTGSIDAGPATTQDMTITEMNHTKKGPTYPWNTDVTIQSLEVDNVEPSSDKSSLTLDETLDEVLDESPIKIGVAHIQPLEPRIFNMISINGHTFSENPNGIPVVGESELRTPQLSRDVPCIPNLLPFTPQQEKTPQIGPPMKDNRSIKSEAGNDITTTEEGPTSKRKTKPSSTKTTTKRSRMSNTDNNISPTKLPKLSPTKITKPRKVATKKSTIGEPVASSQQISTPPAKITTELSNMKGATLGLISPSPMFSNEDK